MRNLGVAPQALFILVLCLLITFNLTNTIFAQQNQIQQKFCPVMTDNEIDPNILTEYKGEKVYFCCPDCKSKFLENPEKYLVNLPQFKNQKSSEESINRDHNQVVSNKNEKASHLPAVLPPENSSSFSLEKLIVPMGVITLILVLSTAIVGYSQRYKPQILFKVHKRLAYITVISALIHASLVLFFL